jgi:hypothetical protein
MMVSQERRFALIFRQASPTEVVHLFGSANQAAVKRLAKRLGCEYSVGEPTYDEVKRIIQGCLTLRQDTYLEELIAVLQEGVSETAEETLGDAYENPSEEDVTRLTPALIDKHGKLATSIYYCLVIHLDLNAASLLGKYFARGGMFEVREDDSPSVPLVRPVPRAVDEETRLRRRERRAKRKKSIFAAPPSVVRRRRKKLRNDAEDQSLIKPAVGDGEPPKPIPLQRLEHPHVQTDGGLSTTDDFVGAIFNAYIPYEAGKPELGGKTRPCIVIAVSEDWFLVRLVFSRPWRYAGVWRSVRIEDWRSAGLNNQSYVSTDRRMVKRDRATFEGRLTTKDWNRVCRGEVNSEGNL